MRTTSALLLALAASFACAQAPADPATEFQKKWDALAKKAAKEHLSLAKFCTSKKIHEPGYREYQRTVLLDASSAEAQKALGRKQENGAWVDDPKAPAKTKNEGALSELQPVLAEYESKKRAASEKLVKEFETLADWCEKSSLAQEAKDLLKQVMEHYDSNHARARKAWGWVNEGGRWISPEDVAKREAGAKKVAGAPEGQPVTDASPVEQRTGWKLTKRRSAHFYMEGFFTDAEMIELVKAAEGARTAFLETFELGPEELGGEIHGVMLKTKEEYQKYLEKDPLIKDSDKKAYMEYSGYPWLSPGGFVGFQGDRGFDYMKDYATHMTIHQLLWRFSKIFPMPAWLMEGLSYWFTDRLLKTALTYCIRMESSAGGVREHQNVLDWKGIVKGTLKDGTDPDLREIMEGSLNALSLKKAMKAWSVTDFLLAKHKPALVAYLRELKAKVAPEDALKKCFGVKSYGELDALWEKWVLETY